MHAAKETASYWSQFLDRPHYDDAQLSKTVRADVAIVGAGLTGMLCAYWIARSCPGIKILILDQARVGTGASSKNAGVVLSRPYIHLESAFGLDVVDFTNQELTNAPDVLQNLIDKELLACDFARTKLLTTALNSQQAHRLRAVAKRYQQYGAHCVLLDRQETRAAIESPIFYAALEHAGIAVLNPGKLLQTLHSLLRMLTVTIVECTPVLSIENGNVLSVRTRNSVIQAQWVVLATSAPVHCSDVSQNWLEPVQQQSFLVATVPVPEQLRHLGWAEHFCISDISNVSCYARRSNDRILFGGRMGFHGVTCSPERRASIFHRLILELGRWFPGVRSAPVSHRWRGLIDVSPLGIPVIERHLSARRLIRVCGYSGLGIAAATVCSRAVADIVMGSGDRWAKLAYLVAGESACQFPTALRTLRERLRAGSGSLRDRLDRVRSGVSNA